MTGDQLTGRGRILIVEQMNEPLDTRTEYTNGDTCVWQYERPNGNPEPDQPSDCYDVVDCGAVVTYDVGGWRCAAGHGLRTYGGPEHDETQLMDEHELAARR